MVALMQLSFTAPVCYIVSRPKLETKTARLVLPLAVVNVMNVVSGLISIPSDTCLSAVACDPWCFRQAQEDLQYLCTLP